MWYRGRVASFWDSLRAAFGTASAGRKRAKPATRSRGRTALKYGDKGKQGTRTRAQLADRYDRTPPAGQKVRKTSAKFPGAPMGYRAFEGNWPRPTVRVRETLEGTRSQLAQRRATRAAQGYASSTPHRLSGEGARPAVRGRGVAPRPASPLPGDRTPVARGRRQPKTTGRAFAFPGSGR